MLQAVIFAFPGLEFTASLLCISPDIKTPEHIQEATSKKAFAKLRKATTETAYGTVTDFITCAARHHL